MTSSVALKRTPLYHSITASGAKMVDFGGWDMPVQYSGILDEHHAVRNARGSVRRQPYGRNRNTGPRSAGSCQLRNDQRRRKLETGQAHIRRLLYEHGGFVDDILVHKVADDHFFLCVNASNQEKDFEHIRAHNRFDAEVEYASDDTLRLPIQGPSALDTAAEADARRPLQPIRYYWFIDGEVNGIAGAHRPTGYTGEDGFEIYIAPSEARGSVVESCSKRAKNLAFKPCGLGARNTLRLEAKMALYGHELTASINPFEADLGWIVKMDKGDFVGRSALETQYGNRAHPQAGWV